MSTFQAKGWGYRRSAGCALGAVLLVGCAESAPPRITSLRFSPASTAASERVEIIGNFAFADAEGDVETLNLELKPPAGAPAQTLSEPIPNLNGKQDGLAGFVFQPKMTETGDYALDAWITDADGNESNRLSGVVEVR